MQELLSNRPHQELLSNRPHVEKLWEFVDRVLKQKGDEIEFIVLYGSMAKGNWSIGSDYDVLIGLCIDDGKRFIDRLYDYSLLTSAPIDIFAYSQSELDLMFKNFHLTLLESLNHGIALFDRGRWAEMQKQFKEWKTSGVIEQIPVGWRVKREQGNLAGMNR
ncbi:nucleotidyltransferase domain-containing protein [Candidatus Poribacteria bacterium]|nr:nucleotidyltransferase domain-containing protein [Candidatus Poribacteria bacterium]